MTNPTITEEDAANQALFDLALNGLRKQGRPSMLKLGHCERCRYRGAEDERCGFGFAIRDDAYNVDMEGSPASLILTAHPCSVVPSVRSACLEFADYLQKMLHDDYVIFRKSSGFLEWLEGQAQAFADKWGVVYTPPTGITAPESRHECSNTTGAAE